MPYKDPEAQRAYQREWVAKRRAEFFKDKVCACGSTVNLELDHVDPSQKVSHNIWSWSKAKRDAELLKCQVLCESCHEIKSALDYPKVGVLNPSSKLTEHDVRVIRVIRKLGFTRKEIAVMFDIGEQTVGDAYLGKVWSHVV